MKYPGEENATAGGELLRNETEAERLDRNWNSLLQELRVLQTGVQLLTGLLMTLPFQPRFDMLDGTMRVVYLVTVTCSVLSTVFLVAPVGMHRVLFRRHRLDRLVSASHKCAYVGLTLLGAALAGVTIIIFDAVAGRAAAIIASVVAVVIFAVFWLAVPLSLQAGPQPGSGS